jgi:hypothetical protein
LIELYKVKCRLKSGARARSNFDIELGLVMTGNCTSIYVRIEEALMKRGNYVNGNVLSKLLYFTLHIYTLVESQDTIAPQNTIYALGKSWERIFMYTPPSNELSCSVSDED